MSLSDHPKAYGTAAIGIAFFAGILLTLGFKDFYPDLEIRYRRRRGRGRRDSPPLGKYGTPVQMEEDTGSGDKLPTPLVLEGVEDLIGNTPLFRIKSLSGATGCDILAKAEFLNGAGGTPKDRVAKYMIHRAEMEGLLTPNQGDTIYEGTVGSTGISLATLARAKGYKAHICMPSDVAVEKSDLLEKLGAIVERVSPAPITDINHFVNLARRRAEEHSKDPSTTSKGFYANQFESHANYTAHVLSTGPEIWRQTGGNLDAFVAGAGTGGTISGVSIHLKEDRQLKGVKIILADPEGSGLYNKVKRGVLYSVTEKEGTRRRQQVDTVVEGIGLNRLTENFSAGLEYVDDAIKVTDVEAMRMARWLVERDGIFVGSSSAVNVCAAVKWALANGANKKVVTVLCDSGSRHLSKFWKHIGGLDRVRESKDEYSVKRDDLVDIFGEGFESQL